MSNDGDALPTAMDNSQCMACTSFAADVPPSISLCISLQHVPCIFTAADVPPLFSQHMAAVHREDVQEGAKCFDLFRWVDSSHTAETCPCLAPGASCSLVSAFDFVLLCRAWVPKMGTQASSPDSWVHWTDDKDQGRRQ